jgi:hydrogenase maturation protease
MHTLSENTVNLSTGSRTLVVCIGNDLVGDDAAGCEVYRTLQRETLPGNITLLFLGVAGISLLDYLDGSYARLIIVDAVRFGNTPGTLYRQTLASLPRTHEGTITVHALGIREVIEVGALLCPERIPPMIVVIGIEGDNFTECGVPLSPPVRKAIGTTIDMIHDTLAA